MSSGDDVARSDLPHDGLCEVRDRNFDAKKDFGPLFDVDAHELVVGCAVDAVDVKKRTGRLITGRSSPFQLRLLLRPTPLAFCGRLPAPGSRTLCGLFGILLAAQAFGRGGSSDLFCDLARVAGVGGVAGVAAPI